MNLHMSYENLRILKPNIANGAQEDLILLVVVIFVEVFHQLLARIKDHRIAQGTGCKLVLLVVAHVLVEVRLLAVGSLADVTPERLLWAVDFLVNGQTTGLRERFVAIGVLTTMWPFSRVCSRVGTQTAWLCERLSADLNGRGTGILIKLR